MIRVNLLKGRPASAGSVETAIAPKGRNAFVSTKEVLLGGVLLLLGSLILFTQFKKFEAEPFSDETAFGSVGGLSDPGPTATEALLSSPAHDQPREPIEFQATLEPPSESPGNEPASPNLSSATAVESSAGVDAGAVQSSSSLDASPVGQLRQLFVSEIDDAVRVFAGTGTVPAYESFQLENPNRVVVDLPGVVVALPADKLDQTVSHPQVQRVRAALHQTDPPVTRLVLDVTAFPRVEFFPQFNGLYIRVSENAE